MPLEQNVDLRPFTGWFLRGITNRRLVTGHTHLPLDEEYWLALRHPAEVAAVGKKQLATTYPGFADLPAPQQEAAWREFRAYVRQAEGFYRGAAVLPWQSSPLNYYYSFMNLAKAIAVSRGTLEPLPDQEPRRLRHGVSTHVVPGDPDIWSVTTKEPEGVFPRLYQASVGVPIAAGTALNARELLGYISSIALQVRECGWEIARSWFACYWFIMTDGAVGWDVFAISSDADLDRLPAALAEQYAEISFDAAKHLAWQVMRLHAIQTKQFRFLQRKEPLAYSDAGNLPAGLLEQALKNAIPNCMFEFLDGQDYQFCIGMPYSTDGGTVPMNELMAAYATMYFLSSLVRYHPDYMDKIAESTDAWMIENFVKAAPLYVLRQLAATALGYTLIIEHM